ncbi:preprotein translocase subunit SecG [Kineococcus sp. T13]|uniref:preprotein translocase subunit SecG n=1 Tax=Kineococcus vitellinus TaxID=2696565 RepID=UPI0014136F6D|nr:preprotein translocase subunit SecG [Kineococcus vitellinus]
MNVLRIVLQVVLAISSLFLTLLILLHKGKGGGLSDMFGGGVTTSLSGSSMAERNLNRFTVGIALVWFASIVLLGLVERFTNEF